MGPAAESADGSATDVLIAGAGPTGLVLALWLARLGVRARIIDQADGPGTTSRALAVQARTLELYAQLGIADAVIARGRRVGVANLWVAGEKAARIPFGEMGAGLSPFSFGLILPQDEHERLLAEWLGKSGVKVERRMSLVSFEASTDGVRAHLRGPDGETRVCAATYLAGCDGARSVVREGMGAEFPGGTYAHLFYVADCEASGPVMDGELHVVMDDADFLAAFPLAAEGRVRLIGTVAADSEAAAAGRAPLGWQDVSRRIVERMKIEVQRVNWFSTYHVHHRVASGFRDGRVFLLGDAAHIHSPVGGQGMNTGIGDAVNLAWKLAAVLRGQADARLLDGYEPERIAFARRLVATTDRVFQLASSPGRLARVVRTRIMPPLLAGLTRSKLVRRSFFRTLSQLQIDYRHGALAAGQARDIHGGDRMPWVDPRDGAADNFAPLRSLTWQAQVHGQVTPPLAAACKTFNLPLHAFPWSAGADHAGLARDALYVIRPDGYIGLVDPRADPGAVAAYFDARGLRPAAESR